MHSGTSFALARFVFRAPRGTIFAGVSRDLSLQSSPMPWCVLSVFLPYFFILNLFNAFWYFLALARFVFRAPRGTIFAGASRDLSLQSSPMPWCVLSVFFALFLYFELVQCVLVLLGIGSLCLSRSTRHHLRRCFA